MSVFVIVFVCVCAETEQTLETLHVKASAMSIYFGIAIDDLHRLGGHVCGQTHQAEYVGRVVAHLFRGGRGRGSRQLASCGDSSKEM